MLSQKQAKQNNTVTTAVQMSLSKHTVPKSWVSNLQCWSLIPSPRCSEVTFLEAVTALIIFIPKCWHNKKICSLILGHHINHLKPTILSPCHRRTSEHCYIVWQNKRNITATEHRHTGSAAQRPAVFYKSLKAMARQPRRRRADT